MKTINKISFGDNSTDLKNEITHILPTEKSQRNKELEEKKIELINQKITYKEKNNKFIEIHHLIEDCELQIEKKNKKSNDLKAQQKIILKKINQKFFIDFNKESGQINEELYKAFLIFINIQNELECQLKFLIEKKEDLVMLLLNSSDYFKILNENDIINYNNKKMRILTLINKLRNFINEPFELIINYIENTFNDLDLRNKINKDERNLLDLNIEKSKLFVELTILKNQITKNEIIYKKLSDYIQQISSIIQEYKRIFTAKNTLEEKNIIKRKVQKLYENLKQNEFYKENLSKNYHKKKNNSTPKTQIPVKPIPSLTLPNYKIEEPKFSKNLHNEKQTISVKNRIKKKKNNTIFYSKNTNNNGVISTDISENEKAKKTHQTIAKLKSRSNISSKQKERRGAFYTSIDFHKMKKNNNNNNKNNNNFQKKKNNIRSKNNKIDNSNNITAKYNTIENELITEKNFEYNIINNDTDIHKVIEENNKNYRTINKFNKFPMDKNRVHTNYDDDLQRINNNCWASCN